MASLTPDTPRPKMKPLIEKTAYFLGRFLSREVAGNAIIKLRTLIRYDKGVKTKVRLSMEGFSSGNKMASGVFSKRKHAYEFTSISNIVQLRQDEMYQTVLLLVVNLGLGQFEIMAFRTKDAREAKALENTFKYIVSIQDVTDDAKISRNMWEYRSKMTSGQSFEQLSPVSQELWVSPNESSTPTLENWSYALPPENYPGTPKIQPRVEDNFEFLRHETERAKDDTFVRYMNSGYHRQDNKPLNSHAYSAHNKRMFHSQDLKPGLSSRTWFRRETGVQTDFRNQLSYGISKGGDVIPPKLHFRRAKLYVANSKPVTDVICQVMTEPTIPKMPLVTYVLKTSTDKERSPSVPLKPSATEVHPLSEEQETVTIATQTSFVKEPPSVDIALDGRSDSIRKQVHELSEEVKYLRNLIEISKANKGQGQGESPIGAQIIKSNQETDASSGVTDNKSIPRMIWNKPAKKRHAPGPPVPQTPPSVDSAYSETDTGSLEIPRLPKPLYSSTPRDPLALRRSNSFRVPKRSAIPIMKNTATPQEKTTRFGISVQTSKPTEVRPLGQNAGFSYFKSAALQVKADRQNAINRHQPMRATQPQTSRDIHKAIPYSSDVVPKRPHITRIPVSGVYNAPKTTRASFQERPQRSHSANHKNPIYSSKEGNGASRQRHSRSRERVYLPDSHHTKL